METQKKYSTVPFNVSHLQLMYLRQEELESIMNLEDAQARFESLTHLSIDAKTFMYDGRVIFCAGFFEQWPGVIECWMMPSIHVKSASIGFCRILRGYVNDIIKEFGCHRFQTNSPDDELHARFMKFLGLKKEGVMKKYTHNQKDYCVYARTV